jgi:hypothetical protein
MVVGPEFLALGLVLVLLVLIPARRLQLAGFGARTIGAYAASLWLLGLVVAIRPGLLRILIPLLLVAYLAPFIASPDALNRLVRRGGNLRRGGRGGIGQGGSTTPPSGGRPPIKNVTPPDEPGAAG